MDDLFEYDEQSKSKRIYKAAQQVVRRYGGKHNVKGGEVIAEKINVGRGYFKRQLNPNDTKYHLSIDHVVDITEETGDTGIIEALAREFDMVLAHRGRCSESVSIEEMVMSMLTLDSNHGRLAEVIRDAVEDHMVTIEEKENIKRSVDAVMKELGELRNRL